MRMPNLRIPIFKNYIDPEEDRAAKRKLPHLMFEGLLLGGSGLGVLALIFEIAADAFSVAAYQTLLAIYGAEGHHDIAMGAFVVLSLLLFVGIVPAYKAGAYLRPNAGGSGPLVEAIGPPKMRWLSWIGTSLFFLDAILTIIISSISAADVTMLVLPELAAYRILLAEAFAFFIMVVLVALGPKRAVPLFLLGGAAFTLFTIFALSIVGTTAAGNPQWAFLADGIVARLEATGVTGHVVRAQEDAASLGIVVIMQLFLRSMSSAMLGFSGYEVIPASGKHAARPKWKVINTALTLAAVFLIGTGVIQLYAAQQWKIPATEGYSTLLIEYEIVAVQTLSGEQLSPEQVVVLPEHREAAEEYLSSRRHPPAHLEEMPHAEAVQTVAYNIALTEQIDDALADTTGASFLFLAGTLLAIILLLAQGGGYVGGAAVAANASRLGRLPNFFSNDRIGIAIIWGISAVLIPIIRQVVVVEAYYAFGFVSAFAITSTTVYFVRDDILRERGIPVGSDEAKSLRFAGLRGMIASYFMLIVLLTQKTDALPAIIIAGAGITLFQVYYANKSLKQTAKPTIIIDPHIAPPRQQRYDTGVHRAYDQARQRGVAEAINLLLEDGAFNKFNVGTHRVYEIACYLFNLEPELFVTDYDEHHERIEEPSVDLEAVYEEARAKKQLYLQQIEHYSHVGIFMFIRNYHINWVNETKGRNGVLVQRAMVNVLFPNSDPEVIWAEYCAYKPTVHPEAVWQFCRRRYNWAKDQWPNLAAQIIAIWTLQDFGLLPDDLHVTTTVSVSGSAKKALVKLPQTMPVLLPCEAPERLDLVHRDEVGGIEERVVRSEED